MESYAKGKFEIDGSRFCLFGQACVQLSVPPIWGFRGVCMCVYDSSVNGLI
jgi:hypothetical protein